MVKAEIDTDKIIIKLAESDDEVRAAQRLRFKVFYEEYKAVADPETLASKLDIDPFDSIADHLIVIDRNISNAQNNVVGTYRLLRESKAQEAGKFYTSDEYDISKLISTQKRLLELGRSCVLSEYRTRPVLQLLWEGITTYMLDHEIEIMFGCASFHGTDPAEFSKELSYMHHFHRADKDWCPNALADRYINMNIVPKDELDAKRIFSSLPPLIKGYLRAGALIGDGAVIDTQFNTIDVCIIMPLQDLAERYRKHYSRKVNRTIPASTDNITASDKADSAS